MKIKFCFLSLLLTMMLFSCKNNEEEDVTLEDLDVIDSDTSSKINNYIAAIDPDNIIKSLQGKWKETEYPYRVAHFENTTVKFIEEGVVEEPTFREYTISNECPYQVNNLKNAGDDDIFLLLKETSTCEIIKITDSTLTLSGFNVSSNSDYNIVYKKVD